MTFVLASQNKKKIKELNNILEGLEINVISSEQAGFTDEIEETGTTFEENAKIKARAVAKFTNMPTIADDSGLCVDALNGAPGVYSARYADEIENSDDNDRTNKLLKELKDVPQEKRGAKFVSAICCVLKDGKEILVLGECEGSITFEKSGNDGFGYDPVFYVKQFDKTFADITPEQKNKISHRGKALRKLSTILKQIMEEQNDKQ